MTTKELLDQLAKDAEVAMVYQKVPSCVRKKIVDNFKVLATGTLIQFEEKKDGISRETI